MLGVSRRRKLKIVLAKKAKVVWPFASLCRFAFISMSGQLFPRSAHYIGESLNINSKVTFIFL
jgi:hypothetical protein